MNTSAKFASVLAVSTMLLLGTVSCSTQAAQDTEPAATAAASEMTAAKAATAIETFVAAATTKEVSKDFTEGADKKTFAEAIKHIDPAASVDEAATVLADFAMAQYSAAKAQVTVEVDASKVKVTDQVATVPVTAVVVKAGDKKLANSDALAEQINDLVFSEGAWVISFPKVIVTPSATPSAAPTATSSPAVSTTAPAPKK